MFITNELKLSQVVKRHIFLCQSNIVNEKSFDFVIML